MHWHMCRPVNLTLLPAALVQAEERHLAELAALVHDVADHKYR
jgi:hypothetical protein